MIHETITTKSRKTFARMHAGFVKIDANQAKYSLVRPHLAPIHKKLTAGEK